MGGEVGGIRVYIKNEAVMAAYVRNILQNNSQLIICSKRYQRHLLYAINSYLLPISKRQHTHK